MEQMTSICDMVGQYKQRRKKIGELRKIKRLKIDIGRFPFAMMMTRTIPLQSHEISSGNTTTRSDLFLLDYEAFYDHIEEGLSQIFEASRARGFVLRSQEL
ncbi:hypothetical protein Tco_0018808 [Tanacetum coccineum]